MVILVDYANITIDQRRKGLNYIMDLIVRYALGYKALSTTERVIIRLYGGWYHLQTLTREAQKLTSEVQKEFPKPFRLIDGKKVHTVTVNVELAHSLAIEPTKHFWHTYRPRSLPPNLTCKLPGTICKRPQCALHGMYAFFKNGVCPKKGCSVRPEDILEKPEQKLVDTMITADLIHYAVTRTMTLCVVTSDDDMWPGIKSALINGATVVHIHTHARRRTPAYYVGDDKRAYIQTNL